MSDGFDLDAPCGRHLAFRNLVECGETWEASSRSPRPISNIPREPKTVEALLRLARVILDPVIDHFGSIELTYGLSASQLSNRVKAAVGQISPKHDQHAAHEVNSKGNPVCDRGGASADFSVPGASSLEVARWIVGNLEFDRLYFYGDDLPIHVSASSDPKGAISVMNTLPNGNRVPSNRTKPGFLAGD